MITTDNVYVIDGEWNGHIEIINPETASVSSKIKLAGAYQLTMILQLKQTYNRNEIVIASNSGVLFAKVKETSISESEEKYLERKYIYCVDVIPSGTTS